MQHHPSCPARTNPNARCIGCPPNPPKKAPSKPKVTPRPKPSPGKRGK